MGAGTGERLHRVLGETLGPTAEPLSVNLESFRDGDPQHSRGHPAIEPPLIAFGTGVADCGIELPLRGQRPSKRIRGRRFGAPDIAVEPVTTRYKLSGNKALWPTAMSDDGQFTAIVWAPGTTMPAVYLINERGKEAIVNGTVRDGAYMIEGVASRYVFRLGKDSASARRLIDKARQ